MPRADPRISPRPANSAAPTWKRTQRGAYQSRRRIVRRRSSQTLGKSVALFGISDPLTKRLACSSRAAPWRDQPSPWPLQPAAQTQQRAGLRFALAPFLVSLCGKLLLVQFSAVEAAAAACGSTKCSSVGSVSHDAIPGGFFVHQRSQGVCTHVSCINNLNNGAAWWRLSRSRRAALLCCSHRGLGGGA